MTEHIKTDQDIIKEIAIFNVIQEIIEMNFDPSFIIYSEDGPMPVTARYFNAIYALCTEKKIKELRGSQLFEGSDVRNLTSEEMKKHYKYFKKLYDKIKIDECPDFSNNIKICIFLDHDTIVDHEQSHHIQIIFDYM